MRPANPNRPAPRPPLPRRGFSVVETLVAVTVLLIVSGGAYQLLKGGRQVFDTSVRGMDLNQEAHKAMIALGMDIRGASFAVRPALVDVSRAVAPADGDLAQFHRLELVKQSPDFSRVAGGDRNVECAEEKVAFEFRKREGKDGPYVLVRAGGADGAERMVAKSIKFGYFKRVPFQETKVVAGKQVSVYGTGPSVVQVHLELMNEREGKKDAGYRVAFDTSFQIRGCRLK